MPMPGPSLDDAAAQAKIIALYRRLGRALGLDPENGPADLPIAVRVIRALLSDVSALAHDDGEAPIFTKFADEPDDEN